MEILEKIKNKFKVNLSKIQREDLIFVNVEKESVIELITYLKEYEGFSHLVFLTAVDWIERKKFQLTYLLNNPAIELHIGIKCEIERDNPVMVSSHHLWKAVCTYQRELKEMYGIDFPGSPRVDEPFILEGWDNIPPNRRDFDTKKYSEQTYFPRVGRSTNDPAEYMKKKLYPDSGEK